MANLEGLRLAKLAAKAADDAWEAACREAEAAVARRAVASDAAGEAERDYQKALREFEAELVK